MFRKMPEEGLVPDYDSYSAIIRSYLKETVRAYRQFAASHPGAPPAPTHSTVTCCPASHSVPLLRLVAPRLCGGTSATVLR